MIKATTRWILSAAVFFAAGCVSLLPETAPPKPRYHISAIDAVSLQGPSVNWSLIVDDPRTTRIYDSVRIAVSTAPGKIEYFAGGEWADRAPRLFQTALVQTFENSGRILAVGDHAALPVGDIVLQIDIRALHLDVRSGDPASSVTVYARLTDGKGTVHAARLFSASELASSDRADDVVAAMNIAFSRMITEIVNWTYEEGEGVLGASP